jgi:hypothetical protein
MRRDCGARFAQLVDHSIQVIGAGMAQKHIAAGGGHSAQKGTRFNAVGHHLVLQPCRRSTP